jgi:hypothetical protein
MVKKQLYHPATAGNGTPRVSQRVLPTDARIDGYSVPRCKFSVYTYTYTYPDPGDPAVVAIDTVTSDVILTGPAEVASYDQLYARLHAAARPQPAASTRSPKPPPNSPTLTSTSQTTAPPPGVRDHAAVGRGPSPGSPRCAGSRRLRPREGDAVTRITLLPGSGAGPAPPLLLRSCFACWRDRGVTGRREGLEERTDTAP